MMAESPDPTKKGNRKLSPQSVADRSAKDSGIGSLMQIQGLSKDGSLDILLDERLGQEWEMRIGEFAHRFQLVGSFAARDGHHK